MKSYTIFIIIFLFFYTAGTAQSDNAKKIVGCWTLTKMVIMHPNEYSDQIIREAIDTKICFTADGKFTSQAGHNNLPNSGGTYEISPDGRTIFQKRDDLIEGSDLNVVIAQLDQKHLVLKSDEMDTMFFDRN